MIIKHPAMNVIEVSDETLPGVVVVTSDSVLFWRDPKNDNMYLEKRENKRYVRDYTVQDCHSLLSELRDTLSRQQFYGRFDNDLFDEFNEYEVDLFSAAAKEALDIAEFKEDNELA